MGGNMPFVDEKRLINPDDNLSSVFPHMGFEDNYCIMINHKILLIVDPIYLADIYNENDPISTYIKKNGIILNNFGGDVSGPIYYRDPYILIVLSNESGNNLQEENATKLFEDIGVDSGSFVMLPDRDDIPTKLRNEIINQKNENNLAEIKLLNGEYCAYYEQWEGNPPSFYRNIVLKRIEK
jgi:hypothetical protein